jgi:hypothetical protein
VGIGVPTACEVDDRAKNNTHAYDLSEVNCANPTRILHFIRQSNKPIINWHTFNIGALGIVKMRPNFSHRGREPSASVTP